MDLNALFKVLFNIQTVYICLSVYVVSYFLRRVMEGTWHILLESGKVKKTDLSSRIYQEVLLPVFPILIGGLMGFMAKTFVWPELANTTRLGRVIYGAVCGMFSAFLYGRVRAWLKSKPSAGANAAEDDVSLPPVINEPQPLEVTTCENPQGIKPPTTGVVQYVIRSFLHSSSSL